MSGPPANGTDAGPVNTTNANYWTLGTWSASLSDGGLGPIAGNFADISISQRPVQQGSPQKQSTRKKPEIAHFIPVAQSDLGIDPQQALNEIEQPLPPATAIHHGYLVSAATVKQFTDTLDKPLQAVGFIGHSFDDQTCPTCTPYSVGLLFADQGLVATPDLGTAQYPVRTYANAKAVSRIKTQARVVFIAACFVAPPFLNLWNIQNGTTGQALVVPSASTTTVALGHAVTFWDHFLDDLILSHMSVANALNETNAWIKTQKDVNGNPETEQWQVIGDGSVKIN